MNHAAFAFLTAFAASLGLTFAARAVAQRFGMVDRPDGARKLHGKSVALGGGIAILIAAAGTLGVGVLLGVDELVGVFQRPVEGGAVVAGALALFLLGVVDDTVHLRAGIKFAVQLFVTLGLFYVGIRIEDVAIGSLNLQLPLGVSLPVTVFWVVGITNAFNLLDGADGLAGGAALFALLTFAVVSAIVGQEQSMVLALVLAGATLGFLFFNFPPASIYLGDAGSQLLGFSLAVLSIVATQKASTLVAIAVPLVSFGVPILDTALAILRRIVRGQHIFKADRGHIHHRLRELGHSPRRVALILWALSAALGVVSMLLVKGTGALAAGTLLAVGVVLFIFVQRLHVPELLALGRVIRKGVDQRSFIKRQFRTLELSKELAGSDHPDKIIDVLSRTFAGGEFCSFELWVRDPEGRVFRERGFSAGEPNGTSILRSFVPGEGAWTTRFPLEGDDDEQLASVSLHHCSEFDGARMDLRVVKAELLPALRTTLLRLQPAQPISESAGDPSKPLRVG